MAAKEGFKMPAKNNGPGLEMRFAAKCNKCGGELEVYSVNHDGRLVFTLECAPCKKCLTNAKTESGITGYMRRFHEEDRAGDLDKT